MRLGSSIRRRRGEARSGEGTTPMWSRLAALGALSVLVGLAFGWVFATRVLFPAPAPPGDLYEVPDLRGATAQEAAEQVQEVGLSLGTVDGLRHPEADSGTVVGQAPLPGQLASPSAEVRITVSHGPERRAVPDLRRVRADWARNVLEATGFAVRVDSVEDEAAAGRILKVDPEPGTEMALPGEVSLTVSVGPPLVAVPRIVGMSEEEARDTLTSLGLAVGEVEEVFRFGRDQGRVLEQTPPGDSLVQRGSAVRFSVGRTGRREPRSDGNFEP